jgi:hypothetical protein
MIPVLDLQQLTKTLVGVAHTTICNLSMWLTTSLNTTKPANLQKTIGGVNQQENPMLSLKIAKDVTSRIMALFIISSLTIITGSSIINSMPVSEVQIPLWYSAALGGFHAVADVLVKLAKASLDGKLDASEVDEAFGVKRDSATETEVEEG